MNSLSMKTQILMLMILPAMILSQSIKGHIENDNQEAVAEAKIEVSNRKEIIISDAKGDFIIEKPFSFPLTVTISKQNYRDYDIILENSDPLTIILKKDTVKTIETVTIKANKPMLKRKIDRLEYNVDKTPLQNLNAWEILKSTPNVLVKNEELSVRGNSQIIVTINDKKTLMSQEQLKQLLENTDGNNVSSV